MADRLTALQGPEAGARALSLSIDGDPTIDELTGCEADDGLVLISFEPV